MIKFSDFFKVEFPQQTKVKFNMNANNKAEQAWDFLKEDDDTPEYQRWLDMNAHKTEDRNNNFSSAKYVLAFAQYYPLGNNYYVFGGMYEIENLPTVINGIGYKLTLLDNFKEYRRRLVIKVKKPVGQTYNRLYSDLQEKLDPEIYELLPTKAIEEFPGFNNVILTHKQLQYIFSNDAPEWKRQLSSVKGVYCITDTSNGQLYIGSASGNYAGIWQRWQAYANVNDLTGGNKAFEELKAMGADRIVGKFTYSILEILDPKTSDEFVRARESHWKNVFQSRRWGMNDN